MSDYAFPADLADRVTERWHAIATRHEGRVPELPRPADLRHILSTAFFAIGTPIAMSHVIAGFAIGMFFSIASLVPGGLGIMDGSMAAVFVTLGVQFEQAVVAILIFRAAYYGLPIVASLLLAPRMLRR